MTPMRPRIMKTIPVANKQPTVITHRLIAASPHPDQLDGNPALGPTRVYRVTVPAHRALRLGQREQPRPQLSISGCRRLIGQAQSPPAVPTVPLQPAPQAPAAAPTSDTVDAFVTEVLRLHPPAPFTLWRFTTTELDLAGVSLPAGSPVLVDIEGTTTDPGRYAAPCALDAHRRHLPDLTFGDGPHACVGAQLAQLEARVVVDVLREDFPNARLAVPFDELERDPSGQQSRRLLSLPAWLRGG